MSCCYTEELHVHHRHRIVTSTTYRALTSAQIPSQIEPVGLLRSNSNGSDGRTVIPWTHGQLLVWNGTCPDNLAASYSGPATTAVGKVAVAVENRKIAHTVYVLQDQAYLFVPVDIVTLGVLDPMILAYVRELGRRIC